MTERYQVHCETCGRLILELEPDAMVDCITCETGESNLAYGKRTLESMAEYKILEQDRGRYIERSIIEEVMQGFSEI